MTGKCFDFSKDIGGHLLNGRQSVEDRECLLNEINGLKGELSKQIDLTKWYKNEGEHFKHVMAEMRGKITDMEQQIYYLNAKLCECSKPAMSADFGTPGSSDMQDRVYQLECEKTEMRNSMQDLNDKIKWYINETEYFRNEIKAKDNWCGQLSQYKDKVYYFLPNSFLVRKEPYVDRNKWILAMWKENENLTLVSREFKIRSPDAHQVYLAASFFNWECLVLMHRHEDGMWRIQVDVPCGHHEFRFIEIDSKRWSTSDEYDSCWNDFGSCNNWILV
ncbi:unnamed protein product [Soboliphyme baturini]|uniref:AMPK1_CBM domain-containing protein n=1 Tax=Soboliphyme baturini TaxID=241478 RepID=A0A183JAW7_9BILA|nr:unnamed protein product [Soboliphyme baturini]